MSVATRPLVLLLRRLVGKSPGGPAADGRAVPDPVEVALEVALEQDGLDEVEARLAEDWRRFRRASFLDRLLEHRLEEALLAGFRAGARRDGLPRPASPPHLEVVRLSGAGEGPGGNTAVLDVAALEPGLGLDHLIDALIEEDLGGLPERSGLSRAPRVAALLVQDDPDRDLLAELPDDERRAVEIGLEAVESLLLAAPEVEEDLSGELLGGKYRVKGLKGKGSFGNVYEAVDEMLGARVAIKVLNRRAARSPRAIEHFLREARLLTSIDHENIVRWITFDRTDDGTHYFVMEFLGGEELEQVLQREGRLSPERAGPVLLRILAALRTTHGLEEGELLHLDLKPENVFLLPAVGPRESERVKVIDFGIGQHVGAAARATGPPLPDAGTSLESETDPTRSVSVSVSSELIDQDERSRVRRARGGTLLYASPEQCEHLTGSPDIVALDGRSDLYSFGVMAFRMLTGEFPWTACDHVAEVLRNHREVPPRKVRDVRPSVPRRLAAFVDRCLEKAPNARWPDAAQAHDALDAIVNPRTSTVRVASVAALIVATAAILAGILRPPPPPHLGLHDPRSGGSVETILLGQGSPSHEVLVEGWEPRGTPRVALLRSDGEPADEAWTACWSGSGGGIELAVATGRVPADPREVVHLQLDEEGSPGPRTVPFTLAFAGSWRILEARVEEWDTARLLDPRGRLLRVEVEGDASGLEALEDVRLRLDGKDLARAADVTDAPGLYRLPLDALAPYEGTQSLEVAVCDRTGRPATLPLDLVLAGDPVELRRPGTGIARAGGGPMQPIQGQYTVYPEDFLRVTTTRDAEVTARIVPEDGFAGPLPTRTERVGADEVLEIRLDDLGLTGDLPPFRARLELAASDAPFVDRSRPEPDEERFNLQFHPAPPRLSVWLEDDSGRVPLRRGETAYVGTVGPVRAVVERSAEDRRLILDVKVEDEEGTVSSGEGRIDTGLSRDTVVSLELRRPGPHRLRLSAYDDMEGERGSPVGDEQVLEFVADPDPPEVELTPSGFRDGGDHLLVTPVCTPAVELTAKDASPLDGGTWVLTGPRGFQKTGSLPEADGHVIRAPELFGADEEQPDGEFLLHVEVRDRAGNTGSAELSWIRACEGPLVELRSPTVHRGDDGEPTWPGTGSWAITARVEDPNVPLEVEARIVHVRTEGEVASEPYRMRLDETGGVWEVPPQERPPVDPLWSEGLVRIEVHARDAGGNSRHAQRTARLPFLPLVAPRIAHRVGVATELLLVPGNENFDYVAGGREQDGGARFDRWSIRVRRDTIRPFYLGVTEVTRRTFAAFANAPDGYADPRWWRAGTGPGDERLAELLAWLPGQVPDAPMTGVSQAEAEACARFFGLRLPSLLEWDYALRGGELYRTSPLAIDPVPAELPLNVRDRGGARAVGTAVGPWPVGTGGDVVPATAGLGAGLRELATNVSEWTSTPWPLLPSSPTQRQTPPEHFTTHLAWFVRPPSLVLEVELDGDGAPDHLAVLPDDDRVEVRLAQGDVVRLGDPAATPAPRQAWAQDVDGDGAPDVLVLLADGESLWFRNDAGRLDPTPRTPPGDPPTPPRPAAPQEYFSVGASFAQRGDLSHRDRWIERAGELRPDLGFRLALDAERARALLFRGTWRIVR